MAKLQLLILIAVGVLVAAIQAYTVPEVHQYQRKQTPQNQYQQHLRREAAQGVEEVKAEAAKTRRDLSQQQPGHQQQHLQKRDLEQPQGQGQHYQLRQQRDLEQPQGQGQHYQLRQERDLEQPQGQALHYQLRQQRDLEQPQGQAQHYQLRQQRDLEQEGSETPAKRAVTEDQEKKGEESNRKLIGAHDAYYKPWYINEFPHFENSLIGQV
ncbi:PREDICTED: G-box-binding factor-like [Nicrophorus vespilloides]|uniref:G-box-binding factor-like n=1 Tax=Nicrophorus vespilloides TaxID=110193 RepID=A0ABM1M1C3_NICVS|nr:PREDICTED: G-box-binding factor-like [Nicrophorus vespilloides]